MVRPRDFETWLVGIFAHIGTFALPEEVTAVLGSEDMTDVAHEHLEEWPSATGTTSLTAGTSRASPLARHAARKRPGLHAARAQRRLIESCTDLDKLDTWFDRSLTAPAVAEIIED